MKKSLQVLLMLSVYSLTSAQQQRAQYGNLPKINHPAANKGVAHTLFDRMAAETIPFSQAFQKNETVTSANKTEANSTQWYTFETIGTTKYDLQTNSSVSNRIVNNSDGTISAVWTASWDGNSTSYATRGTGYNYFNGTAWGGAPSEKIESDRTGFPTIVITNSGKEYVLAHNTNKMELHESFRSSKGTGTWTSDTTLKSPHTEGNFWSKTALGGTNRESIHAISLTFGAVGTTTVLATYKGQLGAILYSRSLDGGTTWDKVNVDLPLIDSSSYYGFGGDGYTIDAKGDTVVIIAGGLTNDVVMLKSVDNGDTWAKTVIRAFPIPKYNSATMISDIDNDLVADTIESNDASIAALIDNAGLVHVFYGRMNMVDNAEGSFYFPSTDGLFYWNENLAQDIIIAGVKDMDGDSLLFFNEVASGTFPFGNYGQSLTSFPSVGVDANNSIYLAYSSIAEFTANGNNKSYRHQYVMRSDDQGTTWWPSLDVTEPYVFDQGSLPTVEGVFGSIARKVDTHVHLIYQRDSGPGIAVYSGTPGPDVDEQDGNNNIVYVKIPVENLQGNEVGIEPVNSRIGIKTYPNPASANLNLMIEATANGKAQIAVSNIIGQRLTTFSEYIAPGTNTIKLNVEGYDAGIYFVETIVGNSKSVLKVVIE